MFWFYSSVDMSNIFPGMTYVMFEVDLAGPTITFSRYMLRGIGVPVLPLSVPSVLFPSATSSLPPFRVLNLLENILLILLLLFFSVFFSSSAAAVSAAASSSFAHLISVTGRYSAKLPLMLLFGSWVSSLLLQLLLLLLSSVIDLGVACLSLCMVSVQWRQAVPGRNVDESDSKSHRPIVCDAA